MEQKPQESSSTLVETLRALSILSGVGIYFIIFLGIFIYLGQCADDFLETGHVCTIIGILLGFPAAIYSIYRQLKHYKLV